MIRMGDKTSFNYSLTYPENQKSERFPVISISLFDRMMSGKTLPRSIAGLGKRKNAVVYTAPRIKLRGTLGKRFHRECRSTYGTPYEATGGAKDAKERGQPGVAFTTKGTKVARRAQYVALG